jgi:tripartite-type tricarboxylate transporter receptor subunit TctC
MLANTGVMVINPALYSKLPYQTLRDFTPIARTAMQPLALLVNPKLPVNTLQEFVAYAKARPGPGELRLGRQRRHQPPGARDVQERHRPVHGAHPLPRQRAGLHRPDGRPGAVHGESIPQAAAYHKQGKVKALAVTSRERNPALPDMPTVIESGIKGFEVVGFYGFLAPANLPKDVTAKLSDAFRRCWAAPTSATA